jgi:hypothetical protein
MSVPKEMEGASASIYFTYGDERCRYPVIDVYLEGCYLITEPMYDANNIINLVYTDENDALSVKVKSNKEWGLRTHQSDVYKYEDEIIIVPKKIGLSTCSSTGDTIELSGKCISDNITINILNALFDTRYTKKVISEYKEITGISAYASSSRYFGCDGGDYSATCVGDYNEYKTYELSDQCGNSVDDIITCNVGTGSSVVEIKSGTFEPITCDPNSAITKNEILSFSYKGFSSSVEFIQTCPKCVCDCDNLTVTGKTNIVAEGGDSITIGSLSMVSCMSNPRASSTASWLSDINVSGTDIKAIVEANTGTSTRTASVTVTVDKDGDTCSKNMTIKQKGSSPECYIDGADTIDSCSGGTEQYRIEN